MSDDDELMDDEIGDEADETDTGNDELGDEEEGSSSASSGGGGSEEIDEHTIAARQKVRDELASDVEAFLARGGKIAEIEPNVTADPPKKPESDYRNRPI